MHATIIARPTMWSLHLSASSDGLRPPRWLNLANARSARTYGNKIELTWINGETEVFSGEQAEELAAALAELPQE